MNSNVISIESVMQPLRPPQWERPERSAADLVGDYVAWGRKFGRRDGRGWSEGHAINVNRQLLFLIDAMAVRTAADLRGALLIAERLLGDLKKPNSGQVSLDYLSNDTNIDPKTGSLGDTSIRSYGTVLKSWTKWLIDREIVHVNPFKKLTLPPATKEAGGRPLTPGEIGKLLAAADASWRTLYELALVSGLRANELRSLRQSDLDFERGGVRLSEAWTKNRKGGCQLLPWRTLEKIGSYGLPGVPQQTARSVRRHLALSGVANIEDVDFHGLRRTYSSLLNLAGASEKENQELMRHSAKGITFGVYTRNYATRLRELVEAVGAMIVPAQVEKMLWD